MTAQSSFPRVVPIINTFKIENDDVYVVDCPACDNRNVIQDDDGIDHYSVGPDFVVFPEFVCCCLGCDFSGVIQLKE